MSHDAPYQLKHLLADVSTNVSTRGSRIEKSVVATIWYALLKCITTALKEKKGIRIPSFGKFTYRRVSKRSHHDLRESEVSTTIGANRNRRPKFEEEYYPIMTLSDGFIQQFSLEFERGAAIKFIEMVEEHELSMMRMTHFTTAALNAVIQKELIADVLRVTFLLLGHVCSKGGRVEIAFGPLGKFKAHKRRCEFDFDAGMDPEQRPSTTDLMDEKELQNQRPMTGMSRLSSSSTIASSAGSLMRRTQRKMENVRPATSHSARLSLSGQRSLRSLMSADSEEVASELCATGRSAPTFKIPGVNLQDKENLGEKRGDSLIWGFDGHPRPRPGTLEGYQNVPYGPRRNLESGEKGAYPYDLKNNLPRDKEYNDPGAPTMKLMLKHVAAKDSGRPPRSNRSSGGSSNRLSFPGEKTQPPPRPVGRRRPFGDYNKESTKQLAPGRFSVDLIDRTPLYSTMNMNNQGRRIRNAGEMAGVVNNKTTGVL